MRQRLSAFLLVLCLAGCATPAPPKAPAETHSPPPPKASAQPAEKPPEKPPQKPPQKPPMTERLGGAIIAPLYDVNLMRKKIPLVLLDALDAPYARPRPMACPEIAAQISPLDAALGPDMDHPVNPANIGLLQKGEGMAGDAAVEGLKGATESFIPMRGWVRMLSGAERHDQLVRSAIVAGGVRRAYLKGLALSLRCRPPIAPLPDSTNAVFGAARLKKAADAAAQAAKKKQDGK